MKIIEPAKWYIDINDSEYYHDNWKQFRSIMKTFSAKKYQTIQELYDFLDEQQNKCDDDYDYTKYAIEDMLTIIENRKLIEESDLLVFEVDINKGEYIGDYVDSDNHLKIINVLADGYPQEEDYGA